MSLSSIRRFPSPLRYPGGKGKLANYMKLLFMTNGFGGYEYVEPYAGGASVALTLLFEGYASRIHINDLDRGVSAFWHAVVSDTDSLCRRIADTKVSIWQWRKQRRIQEYCDADPLDLAFSTFFLNRTNRSGIISGGVIGGKGQSGEWKIDARYNSVELIRRIERIASYATKITVTNYDAAWYLQKKMRTSAKKTFVYLDPPYFVKGQELYSNSYAELDHAVIAKEVQLLTNPWVVSYDAHPAISRLYRKRRQLQYSLSYSAADRYRGKEIMVFGPWVRQPNVAKPSNISQVTVDRHARELIA